MSGTEHRRASAFIGGFKQLRGAHRAYGWERAAM